MLQEIKNLFSAAKRNLARVATGVPLLGLAACVGQQTITDPAQIAPHELLVDPAHKVIGTKGKLVCYNDGTAIVTLDNKDEVLIGTGRDGGTVARVVKGPDANVVASVEISSGGLGYRVFSPNTDITSDQIRTVEGDARDAYFVRLTGPRDNCDAFNNPREPAADSQQKRTAPKHAPVPGGGTNV